MSNNSQRYPINMERYCEKTGMLLMHRISTYLEKMGYHTWINKVQCNGVDIEVYKNGSLVIVAEILNWSPYTRLSSKRKTAIVTNLLEYQCERVLIYTSLKNPEKIDDLVNSDIGTVCLQKQILPKVFYNFYAAKNQITKRTFDSKLTNKQIQGIIEEYIKISNIKLAMTNLFD